MKIGKKYFDLDSDRSLIMGILNVTPDSFSDGGKYLDVDSALFQAEKMIRDGADIIDVGGESTRPGYTKISCWDEIARINPVVKAIKERFDVPVSVDTYKWEVAEAVIESGADMINDGFLGFAVVALALVIWTVIVLVSDPRGTVKAAITKR